MGGTSRGGPPHHAGQRSPRLPQSRTLGHAAWSRRPTGPDPVLRLCEGLAEAESPGARVGVPSTTWPHDPNPVANSHASTVPLRRWPPTLSQGPQLHFGSGCRGDAHLSNFGFFAAPDHKMRLRVNDLPTRTLPGPSGWDVHGSVASFAVAGTPPVVTKQRAG
ncbi:MAG: DUF2252 family protein [Candidatus Microthrix sp.]|nr:DUF2252 family protein [Candidatus Microthrix sp.]